MIKSDLISAIEKKTNLSRSRATSVVEAIINNIKEGLVQDGEVQVRGFGSFRVLNKKTGFGQDIRRKRRVAIAKGKRVKFSCGQELKLLSSKVGSRSSSS